MKIVRMVPSVTSATRAAMINKQVRRTDKLIASIDGVLPSNTEGGGLLYLDVLNLGKCAGKSKPFLGKITP